MPRTLYEKLWSSHLVRVDADGTGLLYIDESEPDMHGVNGTVAAPLNRLPYEELCPGRDALLALQKRFR